MPRLSKVYLPALSCAALIAAASAAISVAEIRYLTQLGAGPAMAGAVLGIAAIPAVFFSPFLLDLARRVGHRTFLIWLSLSLVLAALGAALIPDAGLYLPSRMVLVLLAPLAAPALIGLLREEFQFSRAREGLLLGLGASIAVGAATGAVLGGLTGAVRLSNVYIVAAGLFVLAAIAATALAQRDRPRVHERVSLDPFPRLALAFSPRWRPLSLAVLSGAAFWSARDFIVPLMLDVPLGTLGIVFAASGLGAVAAMLPARRLVERSPPGAPLAAALITFSLGAVLLSVAGALIGAATLLVLGAADSLLRPAVSARVSEDSVPSNARDIAEALAVVAALGLAISPIAFGLLAEAGLPFRVVLFAVGAAIIGAYLTVQKRFFPDSYWPHLRTRRRRF